MTDAGLPTPSLVTTDDGLAKCHDACLKVPRIAFDTEFIRTDTFYPRIGLIQICDGDTVWLVDPLAINDLTPLLSLLRDPSVVKVFHSCSEDLEVLDSAFSTLPAPLFDTQVAAAFAGYGFSRGYAPLVLEVLGIGLDKHETRSDWLQRPLSEAQCRYAAEDVWYLVKVYDQLVEDLDPERRAWIAEDMATLLDNAAQQDAPERYYQRIKGAWRLRPGDQHLLQQLACWREQLAREANRPRGYIVPDGVLAEVVRLKPSTRGQLGRIQGIHGRTVRQYGEELLEQLHELLDCQQALPEDFETIPAPLDGEGRKLLTQLRQRLDECAAALAVAPEILARKRDLEELVRSVQRGEPVLPDSLGRGWRHAVIGKELLSHV